MTKKLDVIIKLNNVKLTLNSNAGKVNILREINLTIKSGEAVSVIGPSGSGKTSLLMVMAGLESINGGDIIVAGHVLNSMSEDKLALFRQSHIGIVFQDEVYIKRNTQTSRRIMVVLVFISGQNML